LTILDSEVKSISKGRVVYLKSGKQLEGNLRFDVNKLYVSPWREGQRQSRYRPTATDDEVTVGRNEIERISYGRVVTLKNGSKFEGQVETEFVVQREGLKVTASRIVWRLLETPFVGRLVVELHGILGLPGELTDFAAVPQKWRYGTDRATEILPDGSLKMRDGKVIKPDQGKITKEYKIKVLSAEVEIPADDVAPELTESGLTAVKPKIEKGTKPRWLLMEQGYLNWHKPDYTRFAGKSGGMFGNLPLLLEAMGYRAAKVEFFNKEMLADAVGLIIINVDRRWPDEMLELVRKFVYDGGSLLVLADHTFAKRQGTDLEGWKEPEELHPHMWINEIFGDEIKIKLAFDSAKYLIGGWLHGYEFPPHPMTVDIGDAENEAGVVTGASLLVEYPARSIIRGKYGYRDPGDWRDTRGFIGNLQFDPNEPLGDVALVAEQGYGKGKVLVYGDTSSLANGILTNSQDTVVRMFHYLTSDAQPPRTSVPWRMVLGSLLVLAALIFGALAAPGRLGWVAAALVVFVAATISNALLRDNCQPALKEHSAAFVDGSHGGRFSREGWRDDGVAGINLNLMRAGYFPTLMRRFDHDRVREAGVFITISPIQPYSRKEIDTLTEMMENGGKLIVCSNYTLGHGARSLLDRFGFKVVNRPLHWFKGRISSGAVVARVWDAWQVDYDCANEEDVEPLLNWIPPDGDRFLYRINARTGEIDWKRRMGTRMRCSPVITESGKIFVNGQYPQNRLYALNPDGTFDDSVEETQDTPTGSAKKRYHWPKRLPFNVNRAETILLSDGSLLATGGDGGMIAYSPDGKELWKVRTPAINFSCTPVESPDGNTIYAGTSQGKLMAYNKKGEEQGSFIIPGAETARKKMPAINSWEYRSYAMGEHAIMKSPLVGPDGTIYFGCNDGHCYAVSPKLEQLWRTHLGNEVHATPAFDKDGHILIGSDDNKLYALDPDDGEVVWTFETLRKPVNKKDPKGGDVRTRPAVADDGTIYFGCNDGYLYAITKDGKKLKWRFKTDGKIISDPVIGSNGTIYFGSWDYKIYAVNPEGKVKWAIETPGPVEARVAIARDANGNDDAVYVGTVGRRYSPLVRRRVGTKGGEILAIGDRHFLLNINLESKETVVEDNLRFWAWYFKAKHLDKIKVVPSGDTPRRRRPAPRRRTTPKYVPRPGAGRTPKPAPNVR